MAKRFVMRVELSPSARGKVTSLSKKLGMTQLALVSRLVDWFALQDETIQAACLGLYPERIRPDVARLLLQQMDSEKPKKSNGH